MKYFTDLNFDNEIVSGTVVVDFYADWCKPCQALDKTISKVASGISNVTFGKVDIDNNPYITGKYNINSLPTVIIFKNGNMVSKLTGLLNEQSLICAVNDAI